MIRCINLFCSLSNLIKEIGLNDSQLEDILISGKEKIEIRHLNNNIECDFRYWILEDLTTHL